MARTRKTLPIRIESEPASPIPSQEEVLGRNFAAAFIAPDLRGTRSADDERQLGFAVEKQASVGDSLICAPDNARRDFVLSAGTFVCSANSFSSPDVLIRVLTTVFRPSSQMATGDNEAISSDLKALR